MKKDNINRLISVIKNYLPDQVKYYGNEETTNNSVDFIVAEIIREKVFELTDEEVPHSITCLVDSIEYGITSHTINASIIVYSDASKTIIIDK